MFGRDLHAYMHNPVSLHFFACILCLHLCYKDHQQHCKLDHLICHKLKKEAQQQFISSVSKSTKDSSRKQRTNPGDKSIVQSVLAMLCIVLLKDSESFKKIKVVILLPKSCLSKSVSRKIHFYINYFENLFEEVVDSSSLHLPGVPGFIFLSCQKMRKKSQ